MTIIIYNKPERALIADRAQTNGNNVRAASKLYYVADAIWGAAGPQPTLAMERACNLTELRDAMQLATPYAKGSYESYGPMELFVVPKEGEAILFSFVGDQFAELPLADNSATGAYAVYWHRRKSTNLSDAREFATLVSRLEGLQDRDGLVDVATVENW